MSGWSDALRWTVVAGLGLALLVALAWLIWALRRGSRDGERVRSLAEQAEALARAREGERSGQRLALALRRMWGKALHRGGRKSERALPDRSEGVLPPHDGGNPSDD